MPRINLSIDEKLYSILEKDAKSLNCTVNVHVISILEKIYKQNPFDYQSALNKLIEEALEKKNGDEFTLVDLPSFTEICVAKAEDAKVKPSIVRARLGKMFNSAVSTGKISGVKRQTVTKNGSTELKFIARAAVYVKEKKKMKLIEWNINKRSNHVISPSFVSERILKLEPDVICLVEYVADSGIRSALNEHYWFAESIKESGNQVLIAVSKNYAHNGIRVICDKEQKGCYNFLHINFKDSAGEIISIIGVRMLTGRGENKIDAIKQTPPLNKYLESIKTKLICVGDFNIREYRMSKWFPNYKIQVVKESNEPANRSSFFFPDDYNEEIKTLGILDHVLVRKDVKVEAEYSWDFISDDVMYPYQEISAISVGKQYFKIPIGIPDHGIMICNIDY
jgi:exonuclease III